MIKRQECLDRIRGVESEYLAASVAVALLEQRLRADPSFGKNPRWGNRDVINLRDNLEATYLIRMCAEFESALRDIWLHCYEQTTQPTLRDVLLALGARRFVPPEWMDTAQLLRQFRNALVHQGDATTEAISFVEARNYLCRFVSCMPEDW